MTANRCPICGTDEHLLIDFESRVRSHDCPAAGVVIYWRGCLFGTNYLAVSTGRVTLQPVS